MIIIRTDANQTIATGHMMRCLTIADAFVALGCKVTFVLADEKSHEVFIKLNLPYQNFKVFILNTKFDDMLTEIPDFLSIIKKENAQAVLVDSYFATNEYLQAIKQVLPVFYLDDFGTKDIPADVVISYGLAANKEKESTQTALLGPSFAPIRAQFRDVPYATRLKVRNILITAGGSDEENLTGQILSVLERSFHQGEIFHVVCGILNPHREKLLERSQKTRRILYYENVAHMATLMRTCDLALTAAGTTVYELCAVGVPMICFAIAPNQRPNARALEACGAAIFGGEVGDKVMLSSFDVAEHIQNLTNNFSRRLRMTATMRELVDGYGAVRIAEYCVKYSRKI